MRLELQAWAPDQSKRSGALIEAKNTLPTDAGYASLRSLASFSDALGAAAVGAYWARSNAGVYYNFAGTATTLNRVASGAWEDLSKIGGYSGATRWEMARFGDRVIAVDIANTTQYYDMGSSTDFADLAGTPPKAATICIAGDFVMLGNLDEGGTQYPNRVRWSGFNDTEWWTTDIARQSDYQDLYGEGGAIQRLVPIPQGAIAVMERSIQVLEYAGPPIIFRVREVEPDRGTPAKGSVCWFGSTVFYYGLDGFYTFSGGGSSPIGSGVVNEWFLENCGELSSIQSTVDRTQNLVVWAFKSSSSLSYLDRLLFYHIGSKRWSWAECAIEVLAEQASAGVTLDGLDAVLGADIDANAFTVDDPAYLGGTLRLVAIDSTHKASTFSGTELAAEFVTSEVRAGIKQSVTFTESELDIEPGTGFSAVVSIGTRIKLTDSVSYVPGTYSSADGVYKHRQKGRYARARVVTAGPFEDLTGIETSHDRIGGGRQ